MRKIREILRLRLEKELRVRTVARSLNVAPSTVGECLRRAKGAGIGWPIPPELDEAALEAKLYPTAGVTPTRPVPEWEELHLELKRKYVTLQLLWEEYRAGNPEGYRYSQFCELYRQWAKKLNLSMRQTHRAGEKMFADYSGGTIDVVDARTGERVAAKLFLAVLGASNYTYAEPALSEELPNWIGAHVRAFEYFGGVPEIVVPDNLKSGVTRPCRYDPDLNPTYRDMATHYGTCVIPARVRRPKDKAKVEVGVQIAERWILARLRNRIFYGLTELKEAVALLLKDLNERRMKKIGKSRREIWETIERPCLRSLPITAYELAHWKNATVNIDYHVEFERHYYSVPYALVQEEVEIRATAGVVEVIYRGKRVASHARSAVVGGCTTLKEHMPKSHQEYLEWSPSRVMAWARTLGPHTEKLATGILERRVHPEQGYRACLGIIRLAKRYTPERVENACRRALLVGAYRYKSVASILEKNLDAQPLADVIPLRLPLHENVRGAAYYREALPC
jgi:transposase